ncbi:hypothetical protein M419DRAFT_117926, partial [Trichoderma reesei RUT C-30]
MIVIQSSHFPLCPQKEHESNVMKSNQTIHGKPSNTQKNNTTKQKDMLRAHSHTHNTPPSARTLFHGLML